MKNIFRVLKVLRLCPGLLLCLCLEICCEALWSSAGIGIFRFAGIVTIIGAGCRFGAGSWSGFYHVGFVILIMFCSSDLCGLDGKRMENDWLFDREANYDKFMVWMESMTKWKSNFHCLCCYLWNHFNRASTLLA